MPHASKIDDFPPYGFTDRIFAEVSQVPPNMEIDGKSPDLRAYIKWMNGLAGELSNSVWPIYNRETGAWEGDARNTAVDLTQADLSLHQRLAPFLDTDILCRKGPGAQPVPHRRFFEEEDGFVFDPQSLDKVRPFVKWGDSFFRYDDTLPPPFCQQLAAAFEGDGCAASASLIQDLKELMQRPRPYQMSLMLDQAEYPHEYAHTAVTPSLVSGHALQATIAGCYTFAKHKDELMARDGVGFWAQFIVDVGDRRVFAGVHYPSDSISSWFCALRLARHIFGAEAAVIRKFLWDAIREKSAVYQAVAQHAGEGNSPYGVLLNWLAAEANS